MFFASFNLNHFHIVSLLLRLSWTFLAPRNLVKYNTGLDTSVQENIVLLYSLFPHLGSELQLS